MKKNPYEILDVNEEITLKELNTIYKKIVLKYHPDRPGGNQYLFDKYTKVYKEIQSNIKANTYKDHSELKNNTENYTFNKNDSLFENDNFNQKI